jgi:hypothetical protein
LAKYCWPKPASRKSENQVRTEIKFEVKKKMKNLNGGKPGQPQSYCVWGDFAPGFPAFSAFSGEE